tara:strand:+ start:38 stop:436 length:399 start_codon:yes stop_codon:yes gene_type:complete
MTSKSTRGAHKRQRQMRMDLEATFGNIDIKEERIKDSIITLFDGDFSVSTKAIKDWIIESSEALESYFKRPSKQEEILRKKLGFLDGFRYMITILLTELAFGQKELEDCILEDLSPLVAEYCAGCKAKINDS